MAYDFYGDVRGIFGGFGLPGWVRDLVNEATKGNWSQSQFESSIYGAPQFEQMFPGIFRNDGTMRYSPGEYLQLRDTFYSLGHDYGFKLNNDLIGQWIGGNTSPQEVADRFTAINRIKEDPESLKIFAATAKEYGLGNISQDTLFKVVMGEGPPQFQKVWEETQLKYAANNSGIDLSQKEAQQIMKQNPNPWTESGSIQSFQKLASDIKNILGTAHAYSMGLSRSDLITLEFGGKDQADVAVRAQRALANYHAQYQQQAHTGLLANQPSRQSEVIGAGQQAA